jgi:hypothetical protein
MNKDILSKKNRFYEKKISVALPCRLPSFHGCRNENFVRLIFERCFQVRDFSFWITEEIGPQKQIPAGSSHTNLWLPFHFQMNYCQF